PLPGQELQALLFFDLDVARKLAIGVNLVPACRAFCCQHHFKTRRPLFLAGMRYKSDDRSAVNWREITIEHRQAVTLQQQLNRLEIVVEEMLVIDLVESQVLDDLLHIQKLHDKDSITFQAGPDTVGHGVQFLEMEKDA